jgi:hypothetical protein
VISIRVMRASPSGAANVPATASAIRVLPFIDSSPHVQSFLRGKSSATLARGASVAGTLGVSSPL